MITVKVNIDFGKALRKIEGDKLNVLIGKDIMWGLAVQSGDYMAKGKVTPKLTQTTIAARKAHNLNAGPKDAPLFMSGQLANSLRGTKEGISGESYGAKHREGPYTWDDDTFYKVAKGPVTVPGSKLTPRKREFIIYFIPSEQKMVNYIYKLFNDMIVKLIDESIRK